MLRVLTRERATMIAEKLLKQLGLDKERIPDLQKLRWEQILDAHSDSPRQMRSLATGKALRDYGATIRGQGAFS